jgi:uncharacterized protein YukE
MVLGGASTVTHIKSEQTQIQWKNNGKSAVYVLDTGRSTGTRDGGDTFKHSDAASGQKWRYLPRTGR